MKMNGAAPGVPSDAKSATMPRRKFLVLGSAAVVGAAAADLPAQMVRTALGLDEQWFPLLSVGYLSGSAAELTAPAASLRRLVGADKLRSGDASLADAGARVTVHEFRRAAERASQPVSVGVNALYRVDDAKVPFLAWTYSATRHTTHDMTKSFVMPVDAAHPLELTVANRAPLAGPDAKARDERAVTESKERSIASFSVGEGRRSMKLRRGVYFLALRSGAFDRTPDWRSISVQTVDGKPVLVEATVAGYQPVSFDYVTVSIDRT